MAIVGWILFGLVVGVVGQLLTPGRDPGGFILTIGLGIAGALLGGFLGQSLGLYREGRTGSFHHGSRRIDCSFTGLSDVRSKKNIAVNAARSDLDRLGSWKKVSRAK